MNIALFCGDRRIVQCVYVYFAKIYNKMANMLNLTNENAML